VAHDGDVRPDEGAGDQPARRGAVEIIPERNFAITVLANSGTGLQVSRELARETCLTLAEEGPSGLAVDEAALPPFTGRYISDTSVIGSGPSGDGGLILKLPCTPRRPSKCAQ
jgi:hypothetical protein